MIRKQVFLGICLMVLLAVRFTLPVSAHVVVKPAEVGIGERLNFSVSVPTEKEVPTVGLRLLIPSSVTSVRPNIKAGWYVETVTSGEGENKRITEIIWTGGTIPQDMRDEFIFSAQAPAKESEIAWKAYQTYADGTIVAWDADPKTVKAYEKNHPSQEDSVDEKAPEPYSMTKVINDLVTERPTESPDISGKHRESFQTLGTIAALALAAVALVTVSRKK